MEKEQPKSFKHYIKYIVLVVLNVFFLFFILFLFMKKWITAKLFIIVVFANIAFYVLFVLIWFVRNRLLKGKKSDEIKETDVITKKQARDLIKSMMKKEHFTLLQFNTDEFYDDVIHMGAEDKPKTPIYLVSARGSYSKDVYRIAIRLDSPSKTIVRKNSTQQDFIEAVKMLAETSPREDVTEKTYYSEAGGVIKTEREVRRTPMRVAEQLQDEKQVEIGE